MILTPTQWVVLQDFRPKFSNYPSNNFILSHSNVCQQKVVTEIINKFWPKILEFELLKTIHHPLRGCYNAQYLGKFSI